MTIQCIKYIHTYVRWIPWTISWWGYRGSMKCDLSCSPPLRWLPHLLLLFNVTLPRSCLGSRHWTKLFIRWNNKFGRTTTNREMMLCNDFPGWWEGYCALLRMIPSRQPGKSLHSIISRFVVVLANLLFHLLKCLGLKHQRRQGWWDWVRGRRRGELCVRRHFRWCHCPTWRSVQW